MFLKSKGHPKSMNKLTLNESAMVVFHNYVTLCNNVLDVPTNVETRHHIPFTMQEEHPVLTALSFDHYL